MCSRWEIRSLRTSVWTGHELWAANSTRWAIIIAGHNRQASNKLLGQFRLLSERCLHGTDSSNGRFGYHLHCKKLFAFKFFAYTNPSLKDHPIGVRLMALTDRSILKRVTDRFSRSTDFNIVYHSWSFEPFKLVQIRSDQKKFLPTPFFTTNCGGVLANLFIQIIYIIRLLHLILFVFHHFWRALSLPVWLRSPKSLIKCVGRQRLHHTHRFERNKPLSRWLRGLRIANSACLEEFSFTFFLSWKCGSPFKKIFRGFPKRDGSFSH